MKNVITMTVMIFMIVACGKYGIKFQGEGSLDDLVKARYKCLQETQQEAATASGYNYDRKVLPSCGAFATCLATKGFYRDDKNGNIAVPSELAVQCN